MKKVIILALILSAMVAGARADKKVAPKGKTVKVENGQIIVLDSAKKNNDRVFKIVDGIVIYKGRNGGLYYWATSKTGIVYKRYLKID